MAGLYEEIARRAAANPDRPALRCAEGDLTYGALMAEVEDLAGALQREQPGPVGVAIENCPAWVVVDLACLKAGHPVVPLPPFFSASQRRHVLADCGATLLISDRAYGEEIGDDPVAGDGVGAREHRVHIAGRSLWKVAFDHPTRISLPRDTAKITYTSGTTGTPKGVCLTSDLLARVAGSVVSAVGPDAARCYLSVLPLAVLLENVAGLYAVLLSGGCYDMPGPVELGYIGADRPMDFACLATTLADHACRSTILVPEFLQGLVAALTRQPRPLPALQFVAVGGARVSPSLIERARSVGLPVYEGYGLSECGSVVAVATPSSDRRASVGRVLDHVGLEIAEDGEIIVTSGLFSGYLGQPAQEGPYATGDLGYLDGDGFLVLTGRKRNVIITANARNISPEWPESELASEPEIAQAIVYGEAKSTLSALIVASRPDLSAAAIQTAIDACNDRLPGYARVGGWKIVPAFTLENGLLTGTGRPRREAILDHHTTTTIKKRNERADHDILQRTGSRDGGGTRGAAGRAAD